MSPNRIYFGSAGSGTEPILKNQDLPSPWSSCDVNSRDHGWHTNYVHLTGIPTCSGNLLTRTNLHILNAYFSNSLTVASSPMSNISSIDPELIPVTCYLATLALLGGIGNLIIIVATVKSRAMRSTCNMLIFFICIFDFLHLQGQWQYFIYMLTGIEMEKATCFYWQILPLAGLYFCGPLQLAIAIDRLIAVSLPLKYMVLQYHPMKYFLCLFLPPSIYVLISIWYGIATRGHDSAPCSIEVAFSGETNWFLECILTGSYAVAAITYILVVLIMRIKGANEQFKAVFKAITIYLGLILCTFFFTNVYDLAVEYWIPATRYEKDILHAYAGIAITTCISSNLIVFYCLNRQYRAAVNNLFKYKRRVIVSNSPSAA